LDGIRAVLADVALIEGLGHDALLDAGYFVQPASPVWRLTLRPKRSR
jgi:hypothetical protein